MMQQKKTLEALTAARNDKIEYYKEETPVEVQEFGKQNSRKIMLLPGNMMSWRQFEAVIPLLEKQYHVIAVSTDGYDDTGKTTFTTAEAMAEKLERYIKEEQGGTIDLVFGESMGGATAGMLFHRQKVKVGAMILSGPQYMNLGMFSWVLTAIVPRSQYNLTKKIQSVDKLPWMLRLYTRGDDQKLLNQFQYVAKNISLATLENATKEALRLYPVIDTFAPDPEAKVAIWYGSNEPNMKKAMQKLKRAYPNAQDHPFAGYGHGDIIGHPDVMARDIIAFMES